MPWYGGRPWPRRHCARWGSSSPSRKGHSSPLHFSADVYCGQTTGWIKMPLGTKVGLGQATLCYMGTQLPLTPTRDTASSTLFGPCLLWPNSRLPQQLLSSCFILYGCAVNKSHTFVNNHINATNEFRKFFRTQDSNTVVKYSLYSI